MTALRSSEPTSSICGAGFGTGMSPESRNDADSRSHSISGRGPVCTT
ncbi:MULTISPECIES: hypothetical protein [unclassified Streptomyces]